MIPLTFLATTSLTLISSSLSSSSPSSSSPVASSYVVDEGKSLVCKETGKSRWHRDCKPGLAVGDGSIPDGGRDQGSKDWTKGERHRRLTCRRDRQRRMQRVVVGLLRVQYRCRTYISRQSTKRQRLLRLQGRGQGHLFETSEADDRSTPWILRRQSPAFRWETEIC